MSRLSPNINGPCQCSALQSKTASLKSYTQTKLGRIFAIDLFLKSPELMVMTLSHLKNDVMSYRCLFNAASTNIRTQLICISTVTDNPCHKYIYTIILHPYYRV